MDNTTENGVMCLVCVIPNGAIAFGKDVDTLRKAIVEPGTYTYGEVFIKPDKSGSFNFNLNDIRTLGILTVD